jgi:rare lipoprotein A
MILILFLLSLLCVDCSSCCCLGGGSGFSQVQYGYASYYGEDFHGRKTASGEKYDMYELTCAHKTLPFNTKVKVTNLINKKTVIVRVNDRGPFVSGRIIDLSYAAAQKIGLIPAGVIRVKIEVIR